MTYLDVCLKNISKNVMSCDCEKVNSFIVVILKCVNSPDGCQFIDQWCQSEVDYELTGLTYTNGFSNFQAHKILNPK